MKAAPFDYVCASNLEHALEVLDANAYDAKLIAGGMSLVPMMAMRLARPALLVDINRLDELKNIRIEADKVIMGAATRQRNVEFDTELHKSLPLVRDGLKWVGHVQTRNRGTIGGSLAHADPSAEMPLAARILDATMRLRSKAGGERTVAASEFFQGPMFTAVGETECLVEIEWPVWQGPGVVTAFEEVAMRNGDFAMASAACQLQIDSSGICQRAAFGLGGVDGTPLAFPDLAQQMIGRKIDENLAKEIAHAAAKRAEPGSDMHADGEFRRHLATVLLSRILASAGQGQRAALAA
ncbi:FAD binding domain-containing protein [Lacisediminimonas profundi]|uniref:FAD binding domain-containing protein n=1 Tax=Lacisediminimonas profundi TaxID=2603856 RepID=UPI00124B92CB|nr:FAD binding domain-containing protein [Lacisediminimonas profundi]